MFIENYFFNHFWCFFLQTLTVFSHVCADHTLIKTWERLYADLFLCGSLLFGTFPCTTYCSCLSLPALLASSSQFKCWASQVALVVKNPPAMQETQEMRDLPLSLEDPLEEGMPTCSNIFAWIILWTEEPCGLQPLGCKESQDLAYIYTQPHLSYGNCLKVASSSSYRAHQACFSYHRDHCLSLPAIIILKLLYILPVLSCFRQEGISNPYYFILIKGGVNFDFSFFLYNEICVGRFLRNYP